MKETIRQTILSLGADVCGFAAMERFRDAPAGFSPVDIWPACRTAIAFGVALPKGLLEASDELIYGYFNDQTAKLVDRIGLDAARRIEAQCAAKVMPVPCDGPYDAWDAETMTGKGILSMKHLAVACGLGQMGKSSLLLNPAYGNRLTIGVLLTDLALSSDEPSESICIPGCTRCIDACPAHAIQLDGTVQQWQCRPNTYGRNVRGFDTVRCNACRRVCPMRFGKE